jgi:2-dehydropantoate 2-reductase
MRIGVMGSGAVGGYFGAKLASAGHELVFIARGKHFDAMRRTGLRIVSPNGELRVTNATYAATPAEAGVVDLILFCVKSYDTDSAAQSLGSMIGDHTTILSLQNGIDNPDKIARLWNKRRTLTGVVYVGAQIAQPGIIMHSAGGKIVFGQLDGQASDAAKMLERVLTEAGIPCELSRNIQKIQWTKLLWNAPFCAISCLARADVKQIVDSKSLTQLAVDCMTEVQTAAHTRGVELPRALFDETIAFSKGLGAFKPSMLQDLEARKPLEYEAFNGIVLKLLQQTNQAAPVNQCFYILLQHLDHQLREETAR